MKCLCGAPAHPSTGHRFTENVILCGPCAQEFYRWYSQRMNSMQQIPKKTKASSSFHDNALKSIIG